MPLHGSAKLRASQRDPLPNQVNADQRKYTLGFEKMWFLLLRINFLPTKTRGLNGKHVYSLPAKHSAKFNVSCLLSHISSLLSSRFCFCILITCWIWLWASKIGALLWDFMRHPFNYWACCPAAAWVEPNFGKAGMEVQLDGPSCSLPPPARHPKLPCLGSAAGGVAP